jgi:hypothetical protein
MNIKAEGGGAKPEVSITINDAEEGRIEETKTAPVADLVPFVDKPEFALLSLKLDLTSGYSKSESVAKEDLESVEKFVEKAVREQHEHGDDGDSQLPQYKGIVETLRIRKDRVMLHRILLALRTAGQGSTLRLLTTSKTSRHARLIHNVSRLNAFELPKTDDTKEADYEIADAHFHLLRAIVSSNTIYLVPMLRILWRMLIVCKDDPNNMKR